MPTLSLSTALLLPHHSSPIPLRSKTLNLTPALSLRSRRRDLTSTISARHAEYYEPPPPQQQQQQQQFTSSRSSFPSTQTSPKVFVGYSIYKGKAALTVEPRAPEFAPLDSGAFKVSKEGFVLLQFAPAFGSRQYDWSRKQVFSLSVAEIGNLLCLGVTSSCEFFHDPFKGKSDEGKVRKVLKVEPLPDGSGHFFNLSVQNRMLNVDESIYIPVTKAELTVLQSTFNFILPYLLGWNMFASSIGVEDINHSSNTRMASALEWSR